MLKRLSLFFCLFLILCSNSSATVVVSEGTNISADIARDGRIAIDLLGGLWVVPANGGDAVALPTQSGTVSRPKWSPDGRRIVYQTESSGQRRIAIVDSNSGESLPVLDATPADQHPEWHPDGERLVFSSARATSGYDLWQYDLVTGVAAPITNTAGDETEPAWSADGRFLTYIRRHGKFWYLMLRRDNSDGQDDEILLQSEETLAAPSWRPDGTMITYLQQVDGKWMVRMCILSEPRLHRDVLAPNDMFVAPVSWADRHQMVYTADGGIRQQRFGAWRARNVAFRATVGQAAPPANSAPRSLPPLNAPSRATVIRAGRLFDGVGVQYRENLDVVVEDGRIKALQTIAPERAAVIDLGDVTLIPGLIDVYATLPRDTSPALGPLLLGMGVTTMVVDHPAVDELNGIWSGKEMPGPRLLRARDASATFDAPPWLIVVGSADATTPGSAAAFHWRQQGVAVLAENWQASLGSGANLLLGTTSRPTSPRGNRYQDLLLANRLGSLTTVSAVADAQNATLVDIWRSRAAQAIAPAPQTEHGTVRPARLEAAQHSIVTGSAANGLPPGIALHAELRALADAGLTPVNILKASGVNAAAALGVPLHIGRLAPGAEANFLVVDGDPLHNIDDALNIIGVVRAGRFYSLSGLLDRSETPVNDPQPATNAAALD